MTNEEQDSWEQRFQREQQERSQRVRSNKFLLMNELREVGVRTALIKYDGSGDSGSVDAIVAIDRNWKPIELHERLRSDLDAYAYDVLEERYPGWEINEGSFGNIKFDMAGNKVTLEHNIRIEETERHSAEW